MDEFRRKLTQAQESAGQPPRTIVDASLGPTVCSLVEAGCGVGFVEAARVRGGQEPGFCSFRPAIQVPIFLSRQRGRPTSKLVEAFSAGLRPPPFRGVAS